LQKITIKIDGKEYGLELKDGFASYMLAEFEKNLSISSNNSVKELLNAYLKKCYECYLTQERLKNIANKI
jgi:hypothetical protein